MDFTFTILITLFSNFLVIILSKHFPNDAIAKKFKERDEFQFHALLLEGECTGHARCTLERCQERLKREQKKIVFPVQQLHREGMLKRNLHRHLEYYHMTEEEFEEHKLKKRKTQGRSKSKESQMSIMNFVQETKKSSLRKVLKKFCALIF